MKKSYYLFNPGRLSRKDNTLKFTSIDEEGREGMVKYIPIESVDNLYVFGSLDANSALYNFLGKNHISVHFFDFYEHYSGSFCPKEYLQAGKMQIEQTKTYLDKRRRIYLAQQTIMAAGFNMLKNLKYYNNREKELSKQIEAIEGYLANLSSTTQIDELMGLEGNIRQVYYSGFDVILNDFEMGNRTKQPPTNEVNTLISFGNMMCYTACLDAIYHTQLNPTISYLHEPGARRFSLALDLAEIFKPILVDRIIFRVLNRKEIQSKDFDINLKGCVLKEGGKRVFSRIWDEKLGETIQHRSLKRSISYKHLIKLECYKLSKYILKLENEYKPLKMWW